MSDLKNELKSEPNVLETLRTPYRVILSDPTNPVIETRDYDYATKQWVVTRRVVTNAELAHYQRYIANNILNARLGFETL